jgi:hypothetical protein
MKISSSFITINNPCRSLFIMTDIIGVTFPILKWHLDRFFKDGKTVFIKPATIYLNLKPGQKFLFYQTRQDTGYAGEAIIKTITLRDDPLDFFAIFGDKTFLTKDEVIQYREENKKWKSARNRPSEKRKNRPWIALELEKIQKYPEVKKIEGFVPVSGRYIKE